MHKISKCLKEWNAVIEALGQGKQTILIRYYKTNINEFLLYPSISYVNKGKYLDSFQDKYKPFVNENSLPRMENDKVEIKYYATLEKIIEKSDVNIENLKDYYIWTPEHVKSYIKKNNAQIWVLRAYKLKEPYMAKKTLGMMYITLKEDISLDGIKPVISDSKFLKIVDELNK
jgi:Uncharacterized protein conserved in bacteria